MGVMQAAVFTMTFLVYFMWEGIWGSPPCMIDSKAIIMKREAIVVYRRKIASLVPSSNCKFAHILWATQKKMEIWFVLLKFHFSAVGLLCNIMQLSLGIHGGLVPRPLRTPRFVDAQVSYKMICYLHIT